MENDHGSNEEHRPAVVAGHPVRQAGDQPVERPPDQGRRLDRRTRRDIARRILLQSITVRPVVDAEGVEIGMFEIQTGGRRYRRTDPPLRQSAVLDLPLPIAAASTLTFFTHRPYDCRMKTHCQAKFSAALSWFVQ